MKPQYKGIYTELPKSDIMNTVITDEMVKGFLKTEVFFKVSEEQVLERWDKFKASHSVSEGGESKIDWEIVEIYFGDLKSKDALSIYDFKVKGSRHAHWNIHSVRRLSDGEVFTVGDLVEDGGKNKKIIGLEVNDLWASGLFATIEFGGQTDLSLLTKAPEVKEPLIEKPPIGVMPEWLWREQRMNELQKAIDRYDFAGMARNKEWVKEYSDHREWLHNWKYNNPTKAKAPLFTTEDGKPVFLNDEVYLLQSWVIGKDKITQEDFFDDSFKYFSTKEAAEEYINNHKPVLSYREVMDIVHSVSDSAKGYDNKNYIGK